MKISTTLKSRSGGIFPVVYEDVDSFGQYAAIDIVHVHAYCFCEGKLLVVFDKDKKTWAPPGGHIESGETVEEAVVREVLEESNMRVLKHAPLGFQAITEPTKITKQSRSVCIVEPIGPFVADPDGDIIDIKLIDPKDAKQYFDWGEVGDHLLKRAMEIVESLI